MDMRNFTSVILICIWTWYVSLSDYLNLSLKFYTVPVRLHDVINIVNQNVLSCKHVSIIFYCENMTSFLNYVTATLRTLYALHGSHNKKSRYSQNNKMWKAIQRKSTRVNSSQEIIINNKRHIQCIGKYFPAKKLLYLHFCLLTSRKI